MLTGDGLEDGLLQKREQAIACVHGDVHRANPSTAEANRRSPRRIALDRAQCSFGAAGGVRPTRDESADQVRSAPADEVSVDDIVMQEEGEVQQLDLGRDIDRGLARLRRERLR